MTAKTYALMVLEADSMVLHSKLEVRIPRSLSERVFVLDRDIGRAESMALPEHWHPNRDYCPKAELAETASVLCPQCNAKAELWFLDEYYYAQWFIVCDACNTAVHLPGCDG